MGTVARFNWLPCLFGFLLAIVYIPNHLGGAIFTGWFFLFLTIPICTLYVQAELKNTHIYGLLFITYAIVSISWSNNFNIAYFLLLQLLILGAVFYIGSSISDIKPVVIGLTAGLGISDCVAAAQYFGIETTIYRLYDFSIAGLFVNQNIYCEISVGLFLALVALKLWRWIPLTLPGILMVHSRAAMLGLAAGMFAWGWKKDRVITSGLLIISVFAALIYYRNSNDASIAQRFDLWADAIRGLNLFGNGVGTYELLYPLHASAVDTYVARPKFAHNDLLQLVFEFGIGVTFLVLMILNVLKVDRDEKIILYGVGTISLFAYPFHVPILAFLVVIVAGYITRFDNTNWLVRNSSRPVLFKEYATK